MTISRDHYYRLASDLESERIVSAKALLNELSEADSDPEYKYALDRLIKGLSSSRASARIGFSTCLTELLSILFLQKEYSIADYLQDLDNKIRANITKANGKNERAILFGKIFGYQAVLNSAVFQRESFGKHMADFTNILCELVDLSLSKSWIRETCFATIFQALREQEILPNVLSNENHVTVMRQVLRKLDESNLNLTTEGLLIYLGISASQRSQLIEEAVINKEKTWKDGNPFAKGNLQTLSKVLKDSGSNTDNEDNKQQKGSWQPRLHSVWGLLINEFLISYQQQEEDTDIEEVKHSSKKRSKSSSPKKSKKLKKQQQTDYITFDEFWKAVIDEQFFSSNASPERKYWGFEILRLTISMLRKPELIHIILSKNLVRSLINQTAKTDRLLNKIAKLVLQNIIELVDRDADFRVPLLQVLLKSESGSVHFDSLTKTKTVESLITKNGNSGREDLLSFFVNWFKELQVGEDLKKNQIFLLDQILLVVKSSTGDMTYLLKDLLQLFAQYGFFVPLAQDTEDESTSYNSRISDICNERLKSLLTTLSVQRKTEDFNISQVIDILQELESNSKFKLRLEFDEELDTIKRDAFTILDQIKKFKTNNLKMKCFEVLYSMTIIQLYSGDEDSISLIPELNVAFDKQISEESEESNEILMDILLTFISQKSVLMKQLSFVIWEFLIDNDLKLSTINILTDILITKENKDGQEKLFNNAGDDEEEEEEEHEHEHDEEEEEEEAEEESGDSSSGDEDESAMEEVDLKTNIALAEALGIPTSGSGEVKFDSDSEEDESEEESDDESMSDEQMMAIDSQLSTIFQQRKNAMDSIRAKSGNQRKLDVMDAKQNMIFFKNRVLDLLEKFNDINDTSYLNVYLVKPLLQLIELTLDKQLGEKAHKLLKNKICKSKIEIAENDEITEDLLLELVKDIQLDASKSSVKAHSLASNQASIFISKVLVTNFAKDDVIDKVIDIYSSSLKNWSKDKNSKIQSTMFFDFINWLNSKRN